MAPTVNTRVLFNSVPQDFPEPGKTVITDTTQTIDLENAPLDGGILIKTLVLSIDPYMRGKMRHPNIKSYTPAFIVGEPLDGGGVGVVLRSEAPGFKAGDHVLGHFKHEEYSIRKDVEAFKVLKNEAKLPWSTYVGSAGMPGQTAYMSWKEYSHAKKGETVFVTAGAGPVGSFVIQLAKRDGLKVIASAGSEEKVAFLREIGADVAFNYKTTDTREVLEKEGPIDIYYDNVGGDSLDLALEAASIGARFIECGMISGYNTGVQPCKNIALVVGKSITIQGFIVWRLHPKYAEEFYSIVPGWLATGVIKYREEVTKGIEHVGDVMLAVQKGTNKGKAVIEVATD